MLLCLIIDHNVICYVGLCFIVRIFAFSLKRAYYCSLIPLVLIFTDQKKKKSISFNLYLGDVEVEFFFFLRIMSKLKSPNNK